MPLKNGNGDSLLILVKEIGVLSGSQQALIGEVSRVNTELARLSSELDRKHDANLIKIDQRHAENLLALAAHKADDEKNFNKIFRLWNMGAGALALLAVLWGFFKFVIPLIIQAKALGE